MLKKQLWFSLLVIASLLLSTSNVQASNPGLGDDPPNRVFIPAIHSGWQDEQTTEMQNDIKAALADRQKQGLPVPSSVQYEYDVEQQPIASQRSIQNQPALTNRTITARTTFIFDNPQQAGYDRWPDLQVEDLLPEAVEGAVRTGDYTDAYHQMIQEKFPGFDSQYAFGQEPRRYTLEETIVISYPDPSALLDGPFELANLESAEDILLGFTYSGPHIDYTIGDKSEVCIPLIGCATIYDFRAGFALDWALGLRLPVSVTMSGPDQMVTGGSYDFSTSLTAADWSEDQYTGSGVAGEAGNEFVMRMDFFAGVQAVILEINVCPSCNISFTEDESSSFATPFGTGTSFNLPGLHAPILNWDLGFASFYIGLDFTPLITSTQITADWQAIPGCDASGSGQVTYSEPGVPVSFGPVLPCSHGPISSAVIELSDFNYYFNVFMINISASLSFDLFGYGVWSDTINIITFDLSRIFGGLNLHLGAHMQCNAIFECSEIGSHKSLQLTVPVIDQSPPQTTASLSGTWGNNGWWRSDVQVTLTAVDTPIDCGSGIASTFYSLNDSPWTTYSGPFLITTEGKTTLSFYSIDSSGNTEAAQSQDLWIDKTPPVITGFAAPPPNANGWNNTPVTVHFEAFDAVSGLDTLTPDQVLTGEGANQSVTGFAVDMAGNSASFTVEPINIDMTPPVITILVPQPPYYRYNQTLQIQWITEDPLSGVVFEEALLDGQVVSNGQSIDLMLVPAGLHTFQVTAIDRAGNQAQKQLSFKVVISLKGLIEVAQRICDEGWITSPSLCTALINKLTHVQQLAKSGKMLEAYTILTNLLEELEKDHDKGLINDQALAILRADIEFLLKAMK